MNFDVKIDCRALFNECVDQTLLDYRNRTTEAGQSMTATHTLELSLLDAFMFKVEARETDRRKDGYFDLAIEPACLYERKA